ncbi:MAG: response regulator [Ignavibacteriales bacterium]|nr:response regulator [Ignavibacteriales bacterium]MBP9119267.1 response regulator [Ignavibacterium sp.]
MFRSRTPLILIVDDSDLTRMSLTRLFDEYNCKTESCEDGLFGIQKAISHKPDIIILDILMPNLDGIKTLQIKKVIDELKNIPVIILSGNVNKSNMLAAMENGADKVIIKPFNIDDLISAVNELLGYDLERKINPDVQSINFHDDVVNDLQKIFIESFPSQKKIIVDSVSLRDRNKLRVIFHQIKGVGKTVGLPQVTDICRNLEFNLASDRVDWNFIINQCEKLFSLVPKTQFELNVEK